MDATAMPDELPTTALAAPIRQRRGFALLTPEAMSAVSRKGGKASHAKGKAHKFDSKEGRAAGRKGGLARAAKARAAKVAP